MFYRKCILCEDRLCGLVVRVSGYRYRGPGFEVACWCQGWHQQATSSAHYTTSCKHSRVFRRMGEIIARNRLSWLKLLINCYCCIWLVVYTIVSEMHGHTNIKFVVLCSSVLRLKRSRSIYRFSVPLTLSRFWYMLSKTVFFSVVV